MQLEINFWPNKIELNKIWYASQKINYFNSTGEDLTQMFKKMLECIITKHYIPQWK